MVLVGQFVYVLSRLRPLHPLYDFPAHLDEAIWARLVPDHERHSRSRLTLRNFWRCTSVLWSRLPATIKLTQANFLKPHAFGLEKDLRNPGPCAAAGVHEARSPRRVGARVRWPARPRDPLRRNRWARAHPRRSQIGRASCRERV